MKYKVLLAGKNKATIDEFFSQTYNDFECMTTSTIFDDIMAHMTYFQPHVFVYCVQQESIDDMTKLMNVKNRLRGDGSKCVFVIIGDMSDCNEFNRFTNVMANLTITRPVTINQIRDKIVRYMRQQTQINALIESELKHTDDIFSGIFPKSLDEINTKKHILIVDDNPGMLRLIKSHLHESYDVATANSGKVALKFLENKHTDLILLDYEMPEENGIAVLEKLRANPLTADIPVIFLTGISDRKKIQDALIMKPQGYLLKPIDRSKLMNAISSVIG